MVIKTINELSIEQNININFVEHFSVDFNGIYSNHKSSIFFKLQSIQFKPFI